MIIGENSDIKRSSDDGEPSGTAGIPMLSVLEKKAIDKPCPCCNIVILRHQVRNRRTDPSLFGGAAKRSALGIVEVKKQTGLRLELTYPQYQTFANFFEGTSTARI